jgi:hypothetical protein
MLGKPSIGSHQVVFQVGTKENSIEREGEERLKHSELERGLYCWQERLETET